MSTPLYRRTPAAERRLSMRARLTVFLCGMTALILLLVRGLTTFLLSGAGAWMGGVFGRKYEKKAEIFGGVILILLGLKILLENLGVL